MMLTREVMGLLALGILWANTLLIAAAAGQQLRDLLRRRAALAGVVRGRVARGDGPGGAIAVHRVAQVGRAAEGGDVILFHDRGASGEIFGGVVETADGPIAIAPHADAEVWLSRAEIVDAGACASAAAFDEAHAAARRARGFTRTIEARLTSGQEVFVHGRALVATLDPRPALARRAALAAAFIVGAILLAAACTAVALWPPIFGRISTLGGALCLLFFLLVQPAGTALRDAVLVPSRAIVRGAWKRPAPLAEAAARA
jgi:hypothetical protein